MFSKKILILGFLFVGALSATEAPPVEESPGGDEEDTPVVMEAIEPLPKVGEDRPWTPPNYSGQEKALGWSETAFTTPKGMEDRVNFWVDIYTKYTTNQGILHDSKYVQLIYETLNFDDITSDASIDLRHKEKARRARVKKAKHDIQARLEHLQKLTSPDGLEGDDLRYWQMFANIDEPRKFLEASRRGRLRFQLGQRDRFMEGIYQSGRNLQEMEETFRREGLPIEITRLPFVESSFNLKARSRVGASGIWQFMRYTARSYMRMDAAVDERNDPIRATRAAARILRSNFDMLQSWPLAITGYNHGPNGVQRLVKKFKTNDIVELIDVRKGRFGFASANFFASFLAAVQVEKSADKYFGPLKRMPETRGQEIVLEKPIAAKQVLAWFDNDLDKAQAYNPHVRSNVWRSGHIQKKDFLRFPADKFAVVQNEIKNLKADPTPEPSSKGTVHLVQQGETLDSISSQYGVKMQALIDLNNIDDPRRLQLNQKIMIPEK